MCRFCKYYPEIQVIWWGEKTYHYCDKRQTIIINPYDHACGEPFKLRKNEGG